MCNWHLYHSANVMLTILYRLNKVLSYSPASSVMYGPSEPHIILTNDISVNRCHILLNRHYKCTHEPVPHGNSRKHRVLSCFSNAENACSVLNAVIFVVNFCFGNLVFHFDALFLHFRCQGDLHKTRIHASLDNSE